MTMMQQITDVSAARIGLSEACTLASMVEWDWEGHSASLAQSTWQRLITDRTSLRDEVSTVHSALCYAEAQAWGELACAVGGAITGLTSRPATPSPSSLASPAVLTGASQ